MTGAHGQDLGPPAGYPATGEETLVPVRYGKFPRRGYFRSRTPGLIYGEKVVVQTERGVELGEVALASPKEPREPVAGWVLRRASPEDVAAHERLNEPEEGRGPEWRYCAEAIRRLRLPMELVDVEQPFGGGRLIFYFTAEGRVDFRALVRDLARRFRRRIELRQIGGRDVARLLGDVADCGRELCCRTWLTQLRPVHMKMAKVQKTTLDPMKISGRCGRLKCCLRYEYEAYLELRERLPRVGERVLHRGEPARVVAVDLLAEAVTLELAGGERVTVHADAVAPAS